MPAYVISEVEIVDEAERVVVAEFPSMDRLQAWYASDDYAEALAISREALRRRLLFVDGVGA